MNAKTWASCVLVCGLLLAGAGVTTGSGHDVQSKEYVGASSQPQMTLQTAWCGFTGGPIGIGGVCFDRLPGTEIEFHIDDALTGTPGGWVFFRDANNEVLVPVVHFCTDRFSREIPSGTTQIIIQFWDPAHHEDNPLCTATTGTVTLSYS